MKGNKVHTKGLGPDEDRIDWLYASVCTTLWFMLDDDDASKANNIAELGLPDPNSAGKKLFGPHHW